MRLRPLAIALGEVATVVIVIVAVSQGSTTHQSAVTHQQFLDPPWTPPATTAPTTTTTTEAPPVPTSLAAPARVVPAPVPTPVPTIPTPSGRAVFPTTSVVKSQAAFSSSPASGKWACIIKRESGGNPAAVNQSSGAGGLFQFLPSSWRAYGGAGRPQDASVAEQWRVALHAFAVSGWSPWAGPGC